MATATQIYNDRVVRQFALMTVVWGVVGMLVGTFIAAQLVWPALNFDIPWLTFSRLRPNHTFGVIFAFGGSALMGTCYYIVQRDGHTRLALHAFTTTPTSCLQTAFYLDLASDLPWAIQAWEGITYTPTQEQT